MATHILGRHKIAMLMPLYTTAAHPLAMMAFLAQFTRKRDYLAEQSFRTCSLLARGHNLSYADILAGRFTKGFTHLHILHGDVCPQPAYLDLVHGESCRLDADLFSVVVPIKGRHGLTSTAIGDPANPWRPIRRLTLREVFRLPETFSIHDCIAAGFAAPGQQLWVNTGCSLAYLRRDWATAVDSHGYLRVFFTIQDRIHWDGNAGRVETAPEDWNYSRMIANEGGRVFATRKVKLCHASGEEFYPNDHPWGDWETDEEA